MGKDWTLPMRAALEIALSGGHEYQVGGVFADMYWMYCGDLRHEEGEQIYNQAMAYCDVHDIGTFANCLLADRAGVFEKLGRWDECVSIAHTMLEERSLSPANRIQPLYLPGESDGASRTRRILAASGRGDAPAIGLDEPEWLTLCATGTDRGVLARRPARCRTSRAGSGARCLGRRGCSLLGAGSPCGPDASLESPSQLILSHSRHRSAGDAEHAAELWDRLGYRYEAALALLDTKDEALLRESLTRLTDLGAAAAARVVRRTMRDLGIRSIPAGARTSTTAHPRGLTKREQQILELLSEGQSNEEIAARLFISVRTVEHHVSAILGKLGASTRKGAAKEARRSA